MINRKALNNVSRTTPMAALTNQEGENPPYSLSSLGAMNLQANSHMGSEKSRSLALHFLLSVRWPKCKLPSLGILLIFVIVIIQKFFPRRINRNSCGIELMECGDRQKSLRNILAVQPALGVEDFTSEKYLFSALDAILQQSQTRGLIGSNTVILFPEFVGTWLVFLKECRSVVCLFPSIGIAAAFAILSNLPRFFLSFRSSSSLKEALFRMKADQIAEAYSSVFSRLAKKYSATIVAGSVLLPDPIVVANVRVRVLPSLPFLFG
jgi:hypothetical protein